MPSQLGRKGLWLYHILDRFTDLLYRKNLLVIAVLTHRWLCLLKYLLLCCILRPLFLSHLATWVVRCRCRLYEVWTKIRFQLTCWNPIGNRDAVSDAARGLGWVGELIKFLYALRVMWSFGHYVHTLAFTHFVSLFFSELQALTPTATVTLFVFNHSIGARATAKVRTFSDVWPPDRGGVFLLDSRL